MFVRDRRERIFPCHDEGIRTPIRAYEPPACRRWDLFTDLPTDRVVLPRALQDMDFVLATNLEMMSYEREQYLERVVLNGVDENGESILNFPKPLHWWAQRQGKYPILSELVRSVLCVPATSAPCERLFSHAGLTIANDRASLLPDNAAEIIYLRVAWAKIEKLIE